MPSLHFAGTRFRVPRRTQRGHWKDAACAEAFAVQPVSESAYRHVMIADIKDVLTEATPHAS